MQPMVWYLGVFISAPQILLVILLGFSLFNLKINVCRSVIVAISMGIICYLIRLLPIPLTINTILIIFSITILTWLICDMELLNSLVASLLGVMFYGVLESLILQVFFAITDYTIEEVLVSPLLNIALFIPILLIILGIYLLCNKNGFVVYDLEPNVFANLK